MEKQNLQNNLPNSTLPKTDDFLVSQSSQNTSSTVGQNSGLSQGSYVQKFQFPYNGQNQGSPVTGGQSPLKPQQLQQQLQQQQAITNSDIHGHGKFSNNNNNFSKM